MQKIYFLLFLIPFSVFSQTKEVKVVKFKELEQIMNSEKENLLVVNFWATWCKPCVKELPSFEEAHKNFKDKKVRLLLVSLDYPNELKKTLIPFLAKHNITAEVVLLDAPNPNKWLDKISPDWSGTIPATLIIKPNGDRKFFEKEFSYEELSTTINEQLK